MIELRKYQEESIEGLRELRQAGHKRICLQSATGTGKTPIAAKLISMIRAQSPHAVVWFVAPRRELIDAASNNLKKCDVSHSKIIPGRAESLAYAVHVVSKDTLTNRWEKIKKIPTHIIFDECHLNIDFQKECVERYPDAVCYGMTATPERFDGIGLSIHGGGIYDDIVYGRSIPWMMERDYLARLRYFAPITELEADIYGNAIQHYEKYSPGKPFLVFCDSVDHANEAAVEFEKAGYRVKCIEAKTKNRKEILDDFENGRLDGITNCMVATYGLDLPRVESIIDIARTGSLALYFQKIGRGLRPYDEKESLIYLDMVNNVERHCIHKNKDGVPIPPHYETHIDWNFEGDKKRKRKEPEEIESPVKYCESCNEYYNTERCPICGKAPIPRPPKEQTVADVDLKELEKVPLKDLPFEERRGAIDRIARAKMQWYEKLRTGEVCTEAVKDMLDLADECGYRAIWAYYKINDRHRLSRDVTLLHEIARQKGYKPQWVNHQGYAKEAKG